MISKREPFEIIREILDLGRASRTEIRLSIGLTSRQLDFYVGRLVQRGFLEEQPPESGKVRQFRVTEKGERLLGLLDDLMGMSGFESTLDV